jgi:plastocyanin
MPHHDHPPGYLQRLGSVTVLDDLIHIIQFTRSRCMRRRLIVAVLAPLALLALLGLGIWLGARSYLMGSRPDSEVAIRDFMFSPASLVVAAGTRVRWKNYGSEPHNVRSNDPGLDDSFQSGTLEPNDSYSHRFNKPGTYRYVCSIHSQMVATIIVK